MDVNVRFIGKVAPGALLLVSESGVGYRLDQGGEGAGAMQGRRDVASDETCSA